MYKYTIAFKDFDGNPASETLYFNLTRMELIERPDLLQEALALQEMLGGDVRELNLFEISRVVGYIKKLIRLAYGLRLEDGRRFKKGEDVSIAFEETAAYNAFMMELFEDTRKANEFMRGVMPAELLEAAMKENPDQLALPSEEKKEEEPAPEKPLEELSQEELLERLRRMQ